MSWVLPFAYTLVNDVAMFLTGLPLFQSGKYEAVTLLPKLMARLAALKLSLSTTEDIQNRLAEHASLTSQGRTIVDALHLFPPNHPHAVQSRAFLKGLADIGFVLMGMHCSVTPRCEPVSVLLHGPAGQGKTQFAYFLSRTLKEGGFLANKEVAVIV